ncbi:MAG: acyltransferase [Bacteroidia bacterium]
MSTQTSQKTYFQNMDILRFIAAYMIVVLHSFFGWKRYFGNPEFINTHTSPGAFNKIENIIHNFTIGVDVFFIISGFLITFLLLSEYEKNGKVDVMKFYIRRAFRIWPLYFLMILVAPLLTYFLMEQSPGYLLHFLFAGNFDIINQGTKSVATDHLWSICIEEHFYLICPLLIAFIPVKKLPRALLTIILISILFRAYAASYIPNYGSVLYLHTLSRIDILALGSLFGYLFHQKKLEFNHSLPVRLIIYTIFILLLINVDYNECGTFFAATMKKYVFVLIAAYWMGNFLFNPDAILSVKNFNLLHLCGKVSYGIYMFNPVIIYLFLELYKKYNYTNFPLFILLVNVSLVVVTALSYRFFELPFLNLKEKYAVIKTIGTTKDTTISEPAIVAIPDIVEELEPVPVALTINNELQADTPPPAV